MAHGPAMAWTTSERVQSTRMRCSQLSESVPHHDLEPGTAGDRKVWTAMPPTRSN